MKSGVTVLRADKILSLKKRIPTLEKKALHTEAGCFTFEALAGFLTFHADFL